MKNLIKVLIIKAVKHKAAEESAIEYFCYNFLFSKTDFSFFIFLRSDENLHVFHGKLQVYYHLFSRSVFTFIIYGSSVLIYTKLSKFLHLIKQSQYDYWTRKIDGALEERK